MAHLCNVHLQCYAQAFKDNRMNSAQEVYVFHLAFSG